jgi:hypothetical protein
MYTDEQKQMIMNNKHSATMTYLYNLEYFLLERLNKLTLDYEYIENRDIHLTEHLHDAKINYDRIVDTIRFMQMIESGRVKIY